MKTRIIFRLCCLSSLFFTSCGSTDCPGFPEHLVDYFPYQTGDTLSFVNQNNDSLSFCISAIEKTEDWSFGWGCKCSCNSFLFFEASDPIKRTIVKGGIEGIYPNGKPYIHFELSNEYLEGTILTSCQLYLYEETGKDPYDPKNSALFGETVVLESLENQISRVMIVKGEGIIGFYDQKYNFQWETVKK